MFRWSVESAEFEESSGNLLEILTREREEWRCHQLEHWEREKKLNCIIQTLKDQLAQHSPGRINSALDDGDQTPQTPTTSDSYDGVDLHSFTHNSAQGPEGHKMLPHKRCRRGSNGSGQVQNNISREGPSETSDTARLSNHASTKFISLFAKQGMVPPNNVSAVAISTMGNDMVSCQMNMLEWKSALKELEKNLKEDSPPIQQQINRLEVELINTKEELLSAVNKLQNYDALNETVNKTQQIAHDLVVLQEQKLPQVDVDALQAELRAVEELNQRLMRDLASAVEDRDTAKAEKERMNEIAAEKSSEVDKLSGDFHSLTVENVKLKGILSEMESDHRYLGEKMATLQIRLEQREKELVGLQKDNEKALQEAYELQKRTLDRLSSLKEIHSERNKQLADEIELWKSKYEDQRRAHALEQQASSECMNALSDKNAVLQARLEEMVEEQKRKTVEADDPIKEVSQACLSFRDEERLLLSSLTCQNVSPGVLVDRAILQIIVFFRWVGEEEKRLSHHLSNEIADVFSRVRHSNVVKNHFWELVVSSMLMACMVVEFWMLAY